MVAITEEDIKNARVAIVFPSGENVCSVFTLHLCNLIMRNRIPISVVGNSSSSRIAFNRNHLVEIARQSNSTHLFFLDADMIFPANGLERLFSHNLDIVGATAAKREENNNDAIGWTLDGSRLRVPSPPVKMKMMGPCFMLIKMGVFDKLKQPYFCEPPNWMMKPEGSPDMDGIMPEDEYFCHTAIKAGFDVHCDIELSMDIGHRGAKNYYIMRPAEELPKTPLYPFINNVAP